MQPAGWLDGKDTAGNLGGVADESTGRSVSQIVIDWGDDAVEYNFGELLPGSIRGRVHADDGTRTATSTIRTCCSKACGSICWTPTAT